MRVLGVVERELEGGRRPSAVDLAEAADLGVVGVAEDVDGALGRGEVVFDEERNFEAGEGAVWRGIAGRMLGGGVGGKPREIPPCDAPASPCWGN